MPIKTISVSSVQHLPRPAQLDVSFTRSGVNPLRWERGSTAVMRALRTIACVLAGSGALGVTQGAYAETLSDAISLAYETNPTLQAARASQRATDEELPQAKAGLRPSVQILASLARDQNQVASFPPIGAENTSAASLQLSQSIYTGGRVTNAMDAATADILAGREALRQTEIQVLLNVVTAYVDVRRDQQQLAIAQENVGLLRSQLDETKARFDVGEATRTDTAQSRARLAQAESQLAAASGALVDARAAYDAVVGQYPGDLAPEPPIAQLLPASPDAAFDAAEQDNPQLLQATYAEQASAARLAEAKAGTRPSIAVQGSVGYSGGVTPFGLPANSPFANPLSAYTIEATATMPLFSGGMTSSQIRQAAERNNVDRITIEAIRRQVLQAVSHAWSQLLVARASLTANQAQMEADTTAFEGTREEEQQDLRTTLDVLNAEEELENAKLAVAASSHDEFVAAASVLAETGALTVDTLVPSEHRYDPTVNLRHVRNAVGWTPLEPALQALDHVGAPAPTPSAPPTAVAPPR
jgi:outer membrane protein